MERNATLRYGATLLAVALGPLCCLLVVLNFPLVSLYDRVGGLDSALIHLRYLGLYVASLLAYAVTAYTLPQQPSGCLRWLLMAGPLLSAAMMLFFYPLTSSDIYDALFRARISTHYGGNPFTDLPQQFASDPFYAYVAWQRDPSPYGPVWELLAAVASRLGGDSLFANLLGLKLLAAISWAGCWGLVAALARQLGVAPLRAGYLFAACPLVLFESIGNGHNDLTMVVFMLAAYLALLRGRLGLAMPLLTLAVLVKFVPLLLLPAALVYSWRKFGPKMFSGLLAGTGFSLAIALLCYAPYWRGFASFAPLQRGQLLTNSFAALGVQSAVSLGFGLAQARGFFIASGLLLAVGFALWQASRLWQATDLDDALIGGAASFFACLLAFALVWWQPWYVAWLLPFVALRPQGGWLAVLLGFLAGGLLAFSFYSFAKEKVAVTYFENWLAWVIFPPALAALGWVGWRGRRSKLAASLLLLAMLAACDGSPTPTPPPATQSATAAPTAGPTVAVPTPMLPNELRVAVPASRYAANRDDLLPGYGLVSEQRGSYFYTAHYQKPDGFRHFTETVAIYQDAARAAVAMTEQQAALASAGWLEFVGVGEVAAVRQSAREGGSYPLGTTQIVYRYANAVVTVEFSYGRNYVTDDEGMKRAQGLAAIIGGKLIAAARLEPPVVTGVASDQHAAGLPAFIHRGLHLAEAEAEQFVADARDGQRVFVERSGEVGHALRPADNPGQDRPLVGLDDHVPAGVVAHRDQATEAGDGVQYLTPTVEPQAHTHLDHGQR